MWFLKIFKKANAQSEIKADHNADAKVDSLRGDTVNKTTVSVFYKISLKKIYSKKGIDQALSDCAKANCNLEEVSDRECKFCKHLLKLDGFYTRKDIETLTMRLGYSVFDRCGGAIDKKGNSICPFEWVQEVVINS